MGKKSIRNIIPAPYPEAQMKKREFTVVDNHGYFPEVLLRYCNQGDLDLQESRSTAVVRLEAGRKLAYYHHLGFGSGIKSFDLLKVKVDGGNAADNYSHVLEAQDKYLKAIACLPEEWRNVVIKVCIDDEPIVAPASMNKYMGRQYVACQKFDLARALQRIARFYRFGY